MGIIDDILGKQPEQRSVEFCADRTIREGLSEAQWELEQAKDRADRFRGGDKTRGDELGQAVAAAEAKVEELLEQARPHLIRFTFGALAPEELDKLKAQHRPTESQLTEARKAKTAQPEWNIKTFPPVLVAASCI